MSESANLSSKKKSEAAGDTSSSPNAPSNLWDTTKDWREEQARTGTACKCGAHTSAQWKEGGAEWLVAHISEQHPKEFDWHGEIRYALTLSNEQCRIYLQSLIGEVKETLGNA